MPRSTKAHRRLRARTQALRRAIAALDLLASGTVHVRTKVCGRKNCRCAQDVNARHRPYHEWSRRVTAELDHRGVVANHKRVLRLMRADNLLAVRKQRFVFTTDSQHGYAVYPNLAARLKLTGVNQLWVADITYVRLRETFLYVAIVMDAYSRRVVGWELGENLRAELALGALDRALADRRIEPGIVHHSDRGVQYCCHAYVEKLRAHDFAISMSRTGNPYDNAKAESFMKTLKSEEVYLHQYRDQEEARASIQRFIEEIYNGKRLHSSSAICRQPPSKKSNVPTPARREDQRYEFSEACGNLSVRYGLPDL